MGGLIFTGRKDFLGIKGTPIEFSRAGVKLLEIAIGDRCPFEYRAQLIEVANTNNINTVGNFDNTNF